MRKKTVFFLLLLSLGASVALAKESTPLKKSDSKSPDKMPVYASAQMRGYEETKKALDEATKEPSLKEKVSKAVDRVEKAIVDSLAKNNSDKDKHKDKKENHGRKHLKKHETKPNRTINLTNPSPSAAYLYMTDTTIQANYIYETSAANPYDMVIVVYYAVDKTPMSATGYITTTLSSVPDLSGMTLVSSAIHADGTLASQRFQTQPDTNGAFTQLRLSYDFSGNLEDASQTLIQPLNLKKLKIPALVI